MKTLIEKEFSAHQAIIKNTLVVVSEPLLEAAKLCINTLKSGGKILLFGNGGSAADAQHIAAELVGRYKIERGALAAIALTTDSSALTCISNDYSYEQVFSRQVEALAKTGDVAIGISTSGNSQNVVNALNAASRIGCQTIGLCGGKGGQMKNLCNINIIVPNDDTPRIQEMHILIGHTLCALIDQSFSQ